MSKFSHVWVFSDTLSRLPELMSGAQALGENIQVFAINEQQIAAAFQLGANQVWAPANRAAPS